METQEKEKERKNRFILLILIASFFIGCKDYISRDEKLIDEYHNKAIEIKGDSLFFISKDNLKSIINFKELRELKEAKVKDNISFFDIDGNVVYQTTCVEINNDTLTLSCYDFDKKEEYLAKITINNFEEIKELKKYQIENAKILPNR